MASGSAPPSPALSAGSCRTERSEVVQPGSARKIRRLTSSLSLFDVGETQKEIDEAEASLNQVVKALIKVKQCSEPALLKLELDDKEAAFLEKHEQRLERAKQRHSERVIANIETAERQAEREAAERQAEREAAEREAAERQAEREAAERQAERQAAERQAEREAAERQAERQHALEMEKVRAMSVAPPFNPRDDLHLPEPLRTDGQRKHKWEDCTSDAGIAKFVATLLKLDPEALGHRFLESKSEETVLEVELPSWPLFKEPSPSVLFLRREAFDGWNQAWSLRHKLQARRGSSEEGRKIVVTGNSGIGKSRNMTYCLALALRERRVTVYENREKEVAFAFLPQDAGTYQVWRASYRAGDFPGDPLGSLHAREDKSSITFVDTDNHTREAGDERYAVKTSGTAFLAASPALGRVRSFRAGSDKPGGVVCLAPWTMRELVAIEKRYRTSVADTGLGTTEKEIREALELRLSRVGSAPRYVMTKQAYEDQLIEAKAALLTLSIEEARLFMCTGVVPPGKTPGCLVGWHRKRGVARGDEGCFLRGNFEMRPLSPWLAGRFANLHGDAVIRRFELQSEFEESLMGALLEAVVFFALARGDKAMSCRKLEGGGIRNNRKYTLGSRHMYDPDTVRSGDKSIEIFGPSHARALEQWSGLPESSRVLGVPSSRNQPVVDAFAAHGISFQVTMQREHHISASGLINLWRHVQQPKIVFVVPEYVDGAYKKRQPLKKGASAEAQVLWEKTKQYVMPLSMEAFREAMTAFGKEMLEPDVGSVAHNLLLVMTRRAFGSA